MKLNELNDLPIMDLRALARNAKLRTTKKEEIVLALADDAPQSHGHEVLNTSASLIEKALSQAVQANQPSEEQFLALAKQAVQQAISEMNFSAPSTNGTSYAPAITGTPEATIRWADVPESTCDVNGNYVTPPWWDEFVSASKVSHIELKGSAGSGKTLAVHKLAEEMGKKLAVVTADGGLRKRDLIGQREIANGTTYFDAGEFASSAKNGDWALIDECNFADPDSLGFLNGMTDRAGTDGSTFSIGGKVIDVHPDFRCFITRNPGYAGTKNMNEALKDRFWTIDVPPLINDDLKEMFLSHDMRDDFIEDATYVVSGLYKAWMDNRISYQVSPRRALVASQLTETMMEDQQMYDADGGLDSVGQQVFKRMFRKLLKTSILTKVESKHERDAVEKQIDIVYETFDSIRRAQGVN